VRGVQVIMQGTVLVRVGVADLHDPLARPPAGAPALAHDLHYRCLSGRPIIL